MFFYGLFFSIIYSYLFLPKKSRDNPSILFTFKPIIFNSMIIIPINNNFAFHLHHWVIYSFIILLSFFIKIPIIIIGFSYGLTLQGLSYYDCFNFIVDNPYNKKNL